MRDVSRNSRVTWRVVWQMSSTWHGADNVGKYASFLSCYLLPVCATSCITLDMIISVVELIISPTNTRILYYKLQTNLRFTDFLCLNNNAMVIKCIHQFDCWRLGNQGWRRDNYSESDIAPPPPLASCCLDASEYLQDYKIMNKEETPEQSVDKQSARTINLILQLWSCLKNLKKYGTFFLGI